MKSIAILEPSKLPFEHRQFNFLPSETRLSDPFKDSKVLGATNSVSTPWLNSEEIHSQSDDISRRYPAIMVLSFQSICRCRKVGEPHISIPRHLNLHKVHNSPA